MLLSSKLSPLTLEKALGRLLGLIGSRVEISIYSEEPRGLLASFEGELARQAMSLPAPPAGLTTRRSSFASQAKPRRASCWRAGCCAAHAWWPPRRTKRTHFASTSA